jgi:hypothetical protein
MDCAIFKLMNGEEIIADVVKDEKDSYTLSQPVQVHRNISPINTEVIRCSYWLLFSDSSTIKIDKKNVLVFSRDINKNVVKHYDYFLKNADYNIMDDGHNSDRVSRMDEIVERAEQEYKKRMLDSDEEPNIDFLFKTANTTIH